MDQDTVDVLCSMTSHYIMQHANVQDRLAAGRLYCAMHILATAIFISYILEIMLTNETHQFPPW